MIKLFFYCTIISFCFCACSSSNTQKVEDIKTTPIVLKYAKRFAIKKADNYTLLELFGTNNTITSTFVLYKNQKPNYGKDVYYIKTPIHKVASMSSIYTAMLIKLNCETGIVAIDNVDYYTNTFIQKKVEEQAIVELSKGPSINLEKTMALNPDLLLTFGMGNPKEDVDKKITLSGIPVAVSLDHLEETPLGRAEWIKFFAYFFNKELLADSLFNETEKKYNQLKTLAQSSKIKPSVLTEIKYGDAWYVPSGKSYIANLISDAGGSYFWKNDTKTGSTPLTFEMVYAKAKDCDVWINLYNINTKKELLSYDERYLLFNACKKGAIYNNNKYQNKLGYSNYWETGMTNPDDVLADLMAVFSPTLLPNHVFKYYKKIE